VLSTQLLAATLDDPALTWAPQHTATEGGPCRDRTPCSPTLESHMQVGGDAPYGVLMHFISALIFCVRARTAVHSEHRVLVCVASGYTVHALAAAAAASACSV
jgi:hypothetical protein